jgi:hypothetical protein
MAKIRTKKNQPESDKTSGQPPTHRAGQSISGHPESKGGSRQGNIGHEYSSGSGHNQL